MTIWMEDSQRGNGKPVRAIALYKPLRKRLSVLSMKAHPDSVLVPPILRSILIRLIAAVATSVLIGAVLALLSSSALAEKEKTIAFIPGIASDPFFKAMELGARGEAKKLGINLLWQGSASDYSPQTQMPFVDSAFANGIDALILVPTDPDSLQTAVARAQALNIPVITVDTTVKDQSYLTSYITGDNADGGRKAASTLAEQIGDSGKVFIMSGSPSATTDTVREQGFREEMAKHPKIQIVGREYANSQPAAATSAVNTVLLKFPDLAGIFAIDGTSGTGAVAALRNANKVGQVKLVGYDAYKAEVDALKEGVFTALIAQQPAHEAELALQYANDKLTGKNVDAIQKTVVIPNIVMTKDNLNETQKYMYVE
ncbi:MAG: substrate-binding domain-containing protein [Verrucomicrobia bacterium]|nr:substrate-binding domain-containing protein [Verrucomicrobiota bacterium]